jgi:hypothetical protein
MRGARKGAYDARASGFVTDLLRLQSSRATSEPPGTAGNRAN